MRSKFLKRRLALLAIIVLVFGAIAYANRGSIRNLYDSLTGADFQGNGHGSVVLQIAEGDDGATIASELVDLGVVKTYRTVYKLIIDRDMVFYPGSYSLKLEMSSAAALAALSDSANRISNKVTIKEGLRITQVLKALAIATNVSLENLAAAAREYESLGVPASEVSAEGWLFPATYDFDSGMSAKEILKTMVARTKEELGKFGVSSADSHRVLTLAALIQKEARLEPDFYKVSRVFLNRLDAGMHLQSDATVSYGVDGNTVSTSAADRANSNGYNTYLHAGLPVGPISAPGSVAIDAALHPAEGKWLYFCA
ncbi:MAG: hypothetical protein RL149_264, partial [Actinomycetota bacterium]